MVDQYALARRAVACPRWRWMPGMGVSRWSDRDVLWRTNRVSILADRSTFWLSEGWIPDLTDPATLGCLWALVRDAHGGTIWAEWRPWQPMQGWVVWRDAPDGSRRSIACAPDVVEALVAALENGGGGK